MLIAHQVTNWLIFLILIQIFKKKNLHFKGKLDKAEFIKLFKQLEPADRKVEKYCDFVFYAFDTDNSGTIEFTEFLIAFNIRSKGSLEDRLNWTFNVII